MAKTARDKADVKPTIHTLEDAFTRYQDELLGTMYHMVGNAEDARDAVQEAFIKCWRNRDQLSDIRNLKSWIFRVAINTARDMRETAWRRKRKGLPDDESIIESAADGPETLVEHNEQMAMLRRAVSGLRSEEQEVFLLRQNAQMTYDEISESIGVPTGTVKTRMRLALMRLRKTLAETT